MAEDTPREAEAQASPEAHINVAPSPHLASTRGACTTRWMMLDVLIALVPLIVAALVVFRLYAVKQLAICVMTCVVAEALFTRWRGRHANLNDLSAVVTGVILALSLPWSAPWYVGLIAGTVAIGLGKIVFGGLGQNLFNPAMVGRAFVLVCFPVALGATAYQSDTSALDAVTAATPLTRAVQDGESASLWSLFLGNVNGSLGETSALACLAGGIFLCLRRTASWEIAAGTILSTAVVALIAQLLGDGVLSMLHHILAGALLFGAFFIATDPVSSPLTPIGKWIFGVGIGLFVMLMRLFSGYPEGVMFAVLLMNATTPLINRWTIPRPVGGPAPVQV